MNGFWGKLAIAIIGILFTLTVALGSAGITNRWLSVTSEDVRDIVVEAIRPVREKQKDIDTRVQVLEKLNAQQQQAFRDILRRLDNVDETQRRMEDKLDRALTRN